MHPKVLIVGTVPYNTKSTSRAFDAYFHYWEKENIAQIFSNTKKPCKGHCGTLCQITDQRVLQCWMGRKVDTCTFFYYEELEDEWTDSDLEVGSERAEAAYRIGRKHTSLTHLARGLLWRKRFWCTEKLNRWLDDFNPDCVFLAFSDDYFIPQIALYVAKRFNVPIVSCIGDDYYFNVEKTPNPFYHLYKATYRSLINKVLAWPGSAMYISDKIRDKYNSEFGLDGETVYLASTIQRKPFKIIDIDHPVITYFGNIRMGRNNSLNDIGVALGKINHNYILEIYSNEKDEVYYSVFQDKGNVRFMGSVPYTQVQKRMAESDINIIVEGFAPEDINLSRYSLSTKAADALASGASILTYGSLESGIIDYMRTTGASMVCTEKNLLVECIQRLLSDQDLQREYYDQAIVMTEEHHNRRASCTVSENVINKAISKMKQGDK
ncbi:MAG: glycosyltransferase [Clostridiales bacterium]|nr:glycosyltransferase [Clostridiales bacterium]